MKIILFGASGMVGQGVPQPILGTREINALAAA
jgi:hypothetical protein